MGSDLVSRIVIYFVVNHNVFFKHFCVASIDMMKFLVPH